MQDLRVSLVQAKQVWEDKKANLSHFEELLNKNITSATDIIVFPEMFHTGFSMNAEEMSESMRGIGITWLKIMAKKYNAVLVASLIISENKKYFNRMVFVEPNGKITIYNKIKLFGLAQEEKTYSPGKEKVIVEYKGWKILLQVCYDLRFPEIQRNKVKKGVYDYDLLINVANWPAKRSLHWKSLLQARAIENQSYLIGVNRVGDGNSLKYSGDSAVITPLGEVIEQEPNVEKIINTTLDYKLLEDIREDMPFLKDQ